MPARVVSGLGNRVTQYCCQGLKLLAFPPSVCIGMVGYFLRHRQMAATTAPHIPIRLPEVWKGDDSEVGSSLHERTSLSGLNSVTGPFLSHEGTRTTIIRKVRTRLWASWASPRCTWLLIPKQSPSPSSKNRGRRGGSDVSLGDNPTVSAVVTDLQGSSQFKAHLRPERHAGTIPIVQLWCPMPFSPCPPWKHIWDNNLQYVGLVGNLIQSNQLIFLSQTSKFEYGVGTRLY